MELNHQRILLTGATGGIGKELALGLAQEGAALILVGRKAQPLDAMIACLPNSHRHSAIVTDISTDEGRECIQRTCWAFKTAGKPVDILINNAGCNTFRYLQARETASIRQEMEVNLIAPVLLSQQALHWLSDHGVILNVGSTFGAIGFPGYSSYCAAKSGLQRFSEALDREIRHAGKRVQYVAPRATDTALNDARVTELNRKLGNKTDSAATVARQIVKALKRGSPVTWFGWPEKLFVRLNQLFPSLVGVFIKQQRATIDEYATKTTTETCK